MKQILIKLLTFTEFVEGKPDGKNYELYNGIIEKMQPKGKHEEIIGFLTTEFIL